MKKPSTASSVWVANDGSELGQLALSFSTEASCSEATPAGERHVVAGLFAGIGGIELGMHRAGHRTVLLCDNDPAAMAVLKARFSPPTFPGIRYYDDVVGLADQELPDGITLVTAGFPCQDLSQAGATKGIAGARSGLVGEVFALLKSRDVPWLMLENVPFMLQLARGEAMNVITSALEHLGYRWAYRVVDSRAFGLPQRRRRVYLVASKTGDPRTVLFADEAAAPESDPKARGVACGFYWTEGLRGLGWAVDAVPTLKGGSTIGIPSPPAVLMPDRRVVTPGIVDAEKLQGFPPNWTKPAEAVAKSSARWKLVGNAVSVRAAHWIGHRLVHPRRPKEFDVAPLINHRHWPTAAWNVGEGRVRVSASEWPVRRAYKPLATLLARSKLKPLSEKATSGFLSRARRASLVFPPDFLDTLEAHLRSMRSTDFPASPRGTAARTRRR